MTGLSLTTCTSAADANDGFRVDSALSACYYVALGFLVIISISSEDRVFGC